MCKRDKSATPTVQELDQILQFSSEIEKIIAKLKNVNEMSACKHAYIYIHTHIYTYMYMYVYMYFLYIVSFCHVLSF